MDLLTALVSDIRELANQHTPASVRKYPEQTLDSFIEIGNIAATIQRHIDDDLEVLLRRQDIRGNIPNHLKELEGRIKRLEEANKDADIADILERLKLIEAELSARVIPIRRAAEK